MPAPTKPAVKIDVNALSQLLAAVESLLGADKAQAPGDVVALLTALAGLAVSIGFITSATNAAIVSIASVVIPSVWRIVVRLTAHTKALNAHTAALLAETTR